MKKAIIFSPYFSITGGGEVYTLHFAHCLSRTHQIYLAWNDPQIFKQAKKFLNLDLGNFHLDPTAYRLFTSRGRLWAKLRHFSQYDLSFFLSDGSLPWLFSRTNLLHFQVPFTHLKSTLPNRLKLSRINLVLCNSKYTQQVINSRLSIKSQVLYPPTNTVPLKDTLKKNIILSVGRFTDSLHHKRQDVLVKAFKQMVDQGLSGWILQLAGSSAQGKNLLTQLQKQAGGYPIEFHSDISATKLAELYSQAKIYWHAAGYGVDTQKHPEKAEHFGISTVEALSAGAIPIVINAGGQPEIIQENQTGFLFDTIEELISKTLHLIRYYDNLAPKLIPAGQKQAQNFSPQKFCQRIHQLLSL